MLKKLESYISFNKSAKSSNMSRKQQVTPTGCFSVYVGPEKQRFVMKTEYVNHPLFKMLLEDAELEYGFTSEGPLLLPCEVDLFRQILAEIHSDCKEFDDHPKSGFAYGSCSPFNPVRRLGKSSMAKGRSSYGLLTTPRLLKINPL